MRHHRLVHTFQGLDTFWFLSDWDTDFQYWIGWHEQIKKEGWNKNPPSFRGLAMGAIYAENPIISAFAPLASCSACRRIYGCFLTTSASSLSRRTAAPPADSWQKAHASADQDG